MPTPQNIDLTIIVPCYNEEESLPVFLPELLSYCNKQDWKIIAVNDGSEDKSREILDRFRSASNLLVIHHKLNKGYGGAIKTGILAANTEYLITIDADGQHCIEDIDNLIKVLREKDADMVIGSRKGQKEVLWFRSFGKALIRKFANILMHTNVYDINSGLKLYRADIAKRYINLYPNDMSFSDIITLVFIADKNLVIEEPIKVKKRKAGKSKVSIYTAFQTVYNILNIILLFNPRKIFLSLSALFTLAGLLWGIPIVLKGRGVSVGALLAIDMGLIFFMLGLIAEQLSEIRKGR